VAFHLLISHPEIKEYIYQWETITVAGDSKILYLSRSGILDSLVNREYKTGGLGSSCQSIDFYYRWFPHAGLEVIGYIFIQNINPVPQLTLQEIIFVSIKNLIL